MKKEILYKGETLTLENFSNESGEISFDFRGKNYHFSKGHSEGSLRTLFNGTEKIRAHVCSNNVILNGLDFPIEKIRRGRKKSSDTDGVGMTSPMPGKILKLHVKEGQVVKKGDKLLIMEAMKMEHTITADKDGTVGKLFYQEGDQVDGGVELAEIEGEK